MVEIAHYCYPIADALGGSDGRRGRVRTVVLVVATLGEGLAWRRAHDAVQQRIREEDDRHDQNQENQRDKLALDAERAVRHPVDVRCAQRLSPVA